MKHPTISMLWSQHTTKKASGARNDIKVIRKHFNTREVLQILTINFYSIIYYNSEVQVPHSECLLREKHKFLENFRS
jgi:hypothetical protein